MFINKTPVERKSSDKNVDPFREQRKMFNQNIVKMVNMINGLFTNHFVRDENNKLQKTPLIQILPNNQIQYTYEPLNQLYQVSETGQDGSIKKTLFRKICKNLVVLFAKPIEPKLKKQKPSLPLHEIKPIAPTKRIIITTKDGEVIAEDVKTEICSPFEINDFKNYLYLKLKILVYLNDILNLNLMDDKNKYEKLILNYIAKNPNADLSQIQNKFLNWMKQVEIIIQTVMSDSYDFKVLQEIVAMFEQSDPTTADLCESVVSLCDNADQIDKSQVCNPDRINLYSVTENVCDANLLLDQELNQQKDELNNLDQKITKMLESLPEDKTSFNDAVQSSLENLENKKADLDQKALDAKGLLDRKDALDKLKQLNQDSKELLNQIEKNPVLQIQKELDNIDFGKIRDAELLRKTSLAMEKFSNLFEKDKGQKFFREITNINRDLKTSPFNAKSSLKNLFENQLKPVFEKRFDRDAIQRYYKNLETQDEKKILDSNVGYKKWFQQLVEKSKQAPKVKEELKKEADQRVVNFSEALKEAKTPQQKDKVIQNFKEIEKGIGQEIQKEISVRAKLIQSLEPAARKAFLNAFSKTSTIQEQQNLIQAFSRLSNQKITNDLLVQLQNEKLSPSELTKVINDIENLPPPKFELKTGPAKKKEEQFPVPEYDASKDIKKPDVNKEEQFPVPEYDASKDEKKPEVKKGVDFNVPDFEPTGTPEKVIQENEDQEVVVDPAKQLLFSPEGKETVKEKTKQDISKQDLDQLLLENKISQKQYSGYINELIRNQKLGNQSVKEIEKAKAEKSGSIFCLGGSSQVDFNQQVDQTKYLDVVKDLMKNAKLQYDQLIEEIQKLK